MKQTRILVVMALILSTAPAALSQETTAVDPAAADLDRELAGL